MNGTSLRDPIVLVHGILGFDRFSLAGTLIEYFRGMPEALRAAGNIVPEPPALNPAGSVVERATCLQTFLNTNADVDGRQVHLIAHSMGGLDCRYMISRLGMADRVLSLTTLGTPHRGTPLADLDVGVLGPLMNLLGLTGLVDLKGFFDLTIRNSREFSLEEVPDVKGIKYFSIAGQYDPGLFTIGLLKPSHDLLIERGEGANDGLVSVASATFGTFLGTWMPIIST